MNNWTSRGILSLVLVLAMGCFAQAADSAPAVVWALEQDGNPKIGPQSPPPYLDELAKLGINVVYPDKKTVVPLDWEQLKKCNMVILTGFPNKHAVENMEAEALGNLLDRYMNEGGGVLYIGQAGMAATHEHDALNAWLVKYGAAFEWATVEDAAHTFTKAPNVPWQRPAYLWTENIAASPIAKDVKRLYFSNLVFYSPFLRPLKVDGVWNVLVRAEKTATVFPLTRPLSNSCGKKIAGQERKDEAAPLMAVRQVGKGRLAVLGAEPGALYFDLGKSVGAQTSSVRGDGEHPSDWLNLLKNVCLWVSEPARAAGAPGGAKERATCYVNPEYGNRVPIDWERPDLSWPDSELTRLHAMHSSMWKEADWRAMAAGQYKPFKFLVGAHSAKTGGKGSVTDWKAAAQKAGFDGIVFREKILEMTEAQWKEFETECAAASDDSFLALPGQEFEDWEGNRFMRFNQVMPYPKKEGLTEDGKRVKFTNIFFFNAGCPANFPISVKSNSAPFSDYRVYSAFPVAVYQGGKQIEDNRTEWAELIRRIEYVTPLGIHLLEDPSEVAATASDTHLILLAPSLADIRSNPRWGGGVSMGTGVHNSMAAFASDGPVIEAFLPMNMYRTTLGDRGVPGSYRYRLIIRAKSDVPVERVELWAGDRQLRVFRPGTKSVVLTVDDEHSQQSGLWLKVVDAKKREALATSVIIHDKMLCYVWCGDHCNVLSWGQGVDKQGNAYGIGIATHVKDQFSGAGGPGVSSSDACSYIPWGTDTSSPGLGIKGTLELTTTAGRIPAQNQVLFPDLFFQYTTRDVIQTRLATSRFADLKKYGPDKYGVSYISGWGPYLKSEPLEDIEVVSDDLDFHRNADEPALQLCRGTIRFKKDITMAGGQAINLLLGRMYGGKGELLVSTGATPKPGPVGGKLGRGGYLTWGGDFGNGTLISLDDNFAVSTAADAAGKMTGDLSFGYALGDKTFKKGDTLSYQFVIMLWPMGKPVSDRLDTKLLAAFNIASPNSGFTLSADHGKVLEPGFVTTLEAEGGAFKGTLKNISADIRIPVRIKGLNPNWTAGVWTGKPCVFGPIGNDPEGYAWTSIDPVADAGRLFIGNIVSCGENIVILRAFQLLDGGWRITAHNPGEKAIKTQVKGTDGGPLAGHARQASLAPGEELSWLAGR